MQQRALRQSSALADAPAQPDALSRTIGVWHRHLHLDLGWIVVTRSLLAI
jgi:hypothetical protein